MTQPAVPLSILIALAGFAAALAGCEGPEAKKETRIGCCRIQLMCDNCLCGKDLAAVGDARDEDACAAELKDSDVANGCPAYPGSNATAECSGERSSPLRLDDPAAEHGGSETGAPDADGGSSGV